MSLSPTQSSGTPLSLSFFSTMQRSSRLPLSHTRSPSASSLSPIHRPAERQEQGVTAANIDAVLDKYGIPKDKPIIIQISRFDYLKDPVGVIQAFEMVRKSIDCRLVFAGGTASDDPESDKVLAEVQEKPRGIPTYTSFSFHRRVTLRLMPSRGHLRSSSRSRTGRVLD